MCIRDRGSLAPAMYNAKSSTYREKLTVAGIEVTISLNPRANSSTLKTLPCGTPSSRVKWRDRIEEHRTWIDLCDKRHLIKRGSCPRKPSEWSLRRIPVLHVVS